MKKYIFSLLTCTLLSCQPASELQGSTTLLEDEVESPFTQETSGERDLEITPDTSEGANTKPINSPTLSEKDQNSLKTLIETELKKQNIPGASVAIVKPGKVLFSAGYGLANTEKKKVFTADTLHIIGSISKTLTYTHLLQQVDSGLISLDNDINKYLTFNTAHPNFPAEKITPRMLLNHSSGILDNDDIDVYSRGFDSPISLKSFMKDYFSKDGKYYDPELNFLSDKAPGSHFNYTNMGTALAGYIIEKVKNIDFAKSSEDELLKPLKMQNSAWYLKDIDQNNLAVPYQEDGSPITHYTFADYPNGQLRSSARELGNFLAMVMNKGEFEGKQLLSKQLAQDIRKEGVPGSEYGLGFTYSDDLEERQLFGHSGSEQGTSTAMFFDIKTNTGGIVFFNKQDKDHVDILDALLTIGDEY